MKTLKRLPVERDVVKLQNILNSNGYFEGEMPQEGIFERITHEAVELFQEQHVDKKGKQLKVDGVVGEKTWWALKNPSGEPQRNNFTPIISDGLTIKRQQILELICEEHSKNVHEAPDGSNRSTEIDKYWGRTGVIGAPWCCAFVSWIIKEVLGKYPLEGKHHLRVQEMWRSAGRVGLRCSDPKPGDIFIQIKSGGKGHTGFVVGVSPDGSSIYTGEGNCGNRLKIGKRSLDSIDGFIDVLEDGQEKGFGRSDFDVRDVDAEGTR